MFLPSKIALLLTFGLAFSPSSQASLIPPRPKLVVLLVIDQFRADYLLRFEKRFLPARGKDGSVGGFGYLMSQGAYFPMAEYGLLQSMTCPGHATLLTGAYAYQSGIPVNFWYDTGKEQGVYCAEDPASQIVGAPTHDHAGTSPRNLIASTVGDELKNAGFQSRVVTVALKDRSAIMMGGHRADLAFWMDGKSLSWVSSTYYLPDGKLPGWLQKLNIEVKARQKGKLSWTPQGEGSGLSDEKFRRSNDTAHIGKSFPHEIDAASKAGLAFPFGMELTEAAAERALDTYKLGQGKAPDLLAMSFSSHDYIGHAFGPNSREIEEMTLHEDRLISKFMNHVRKKLPGGLRDVVFVLTGDHGTPPDPDWAKTLRLDAGKMKNADLTEAVEKHLTEKFGNPGDDKWISYNRDLDISFNRKAIASRKVDLAAVLSEAKARLLRIHGVSQVITAVDYANRTLPPGLPGEQALHTYFPGRSGDLVIIPLPYWMVDGGDAVTHLTGYTYDRMVPLVIAGPRIKAGHYPQHVKVIDLAPTLSSLLGVLPPTMSEGRVLNEALTPAKISSSRSEN